ncbi:MAG: TonB-dependent receptor [Colwellia sp.]|nr:TonB-dependent receptor [Colwellia sp.]
MNALKSTLYSCLLIPCFVYADGNVDGGKSILDFSLEELINIKVVVAASGFEQKVALAPSNVTVITHQEWQAIGARNLSDVLVTVPGFHVSETPFDSNFQRFHIRGLSGKYSERIKLLIDGEPFEYLQAGGIINGFRLPLTSFERVEVVKGPGSAIYGADAFAGIINLVSFKHRQSPALIGGRVGSFNSQDLFGRGDFELGASHFQWAFDYSQSDGDDGRIITSDLQTVFDSIFGTSASHAPGPIDEHYQLFTLLAKWQWNKFNIDYFTWRNFDFGMGVGVAQALDQTGRSAAYFDQFKLQYDLSDLISGTLTGTYSHKTQKLSNYLTVFPPGSVLPLDSDGNVNFVEPVGVTQFEDGFIGTPSQTGYTNTIRLTHLLKLNEQHLLRWELGYEEQHFEVTEQKNFGPGILNGTEAVVNSQLTDVSGTPFAYLPTVDRDFYYLSLQDEWKISTDLQLTLGVRYDKYSDFGQTTNPRVGLIWQARDNFTIKLYGGSAFKSPAIVQLYAQNNPVITGNPSLAPETVNTLETGINFNYFLNQDAVLSLDLFGYNAKDLIDTVFDEESKGVTSKNIGEQKGRGGEFSVKWKPQQYISLYFSYSYLSAKNQLDEDIADVPNKMANLAINWQINDNWRWYIGAKWIADRPRASADTREKLTNYTLADTKLERTNIISGLDGAIIINNLFDSNAKAPTFATDAITNDFPLPGRQLLFELSYRF